MLKPKIKVFGMGGGGCDIVDRLIGEQFPYAEYYAVNIDTQPLTRCKNYFHVWDKSAEGGGALVNELYGGKAVESHSDKFVDALCGTDLLFIVAGVGDCVGYGMSTVLAHIAEQLDITTMAIVAEPFKFEGEKRRQETQMWYNKLKEYADGTVVIPSEKVACVLGEGSYAKAMDYINGVAVDIIKNISDYITAPKVLNLDLGDIREFLRGSGQLYYGTGSGSGEDRLEKAVGTALNSPMQNISLDGADRVLIFVAGKNLALDDVNYIAERLRGAVSPSTDIILGADMDDSYGDTIKVSVMAAYVKTDGE